MQKYPNLKLWTHEFKCHSITAISKKIKKTQFPNVIYKTVPNGLVVSHFDLALWSLT